MQNSQTILFIGLLLTTLASIGYIYNSVSATPLSDLRGLKSTFGPIIGLTVNDTGNVDWLLSGTWRSLLTNDPNGNATLYNQSSGAFTAAIEMIRPDGTDRHTHALTNFVVTDRTQNAGNNSTIINGTSTISLLDAPAVDIPTTIERSNNWNVFAIKIDPQSVDYHFGKSPFIYGISANPEFMKDKNSPRS
jgi:hypothetical protein